MEEKNLICIGCPRGCNVTVTLEGKEILGVTGNTCAKGDLYARKEVIHPTRIVTSTVKVTGSDRHCVSVKTKTDIPKEMIFACVQALKEVNVQAPVHIGDVILENVAGTGVAIVATSNADCQ